ncbi:UNVERIFIED_CONTAM: hypothetical protein Sindi_2975600 [Sesamum indicum]
MGGGAWPFLVGGAICLVNSVNERDLSLLTSYAEGLRPFRPRKFEAITGLAATPDVFNESIALADRPGSALTTSLPFVHTPGPVAAPNRLNGPVKCSRSEATWAVVAARATIIVETCRSRPANNVANKIGARARGERPRPVPLPPPAGAQRNALDVRANEPPARHAPRKTERRRVRAHGGSPSAAEAARRRAGTTSLAECQNDSQAPRILGSRIDEARASDTARNRPANPAVETPRVRTRPMSPPTDGGGDAMRDAQADVPWPNGFGRNLRSKTRWFTGFCNSHQVSHFATFFIDARAEISVAESRFDIRETSPPPVHPADGATVRRTLRSVFLGACRAGGSLARTSSAFARAGGGGDRTGAFAPRPGPDFICNVFAVCFCRFRQ